MQGRFQGPCLLLLGSLCHLFFLSFFLLFHLPEPLPSSSHVPGGASEFQNAEGVLDQLSGKKRGEWFLGQMG